RSGFIDGEGDGVGILTDIPRQLWMKKLAAARLPSALASNRDFWVAHLMIPAAMRSESETLTRQIAHRLSEAGLEVLVAKPGDVRSHDLGPNARRTEPEFVQIAGVRGTVSADIWKHSSLTCKSNWKPSTTSISRHFQRIVLSIKSRERRKSSGAIILNCVTRPLPLRSRSVTPVTAPTPTRFSSACSPLA
ncbi:MAG: hypothetical protein K8I60_18240, partial [Anaerolineae bacterium]|nr:hypothetical protein [Anaerolineae bacterium]